jgi:hypothetical protein
MERSTDPGASTAERYRAFAEIEASGLSDCYEEWAHGVADDAATVALIDELPPAKRQPNLVFSAARFLGAPVAGFVDFRKWLSANWREAASVCLSRSTQTNEPGRCASLLPVLAAVPGPLALIEVGASAGLCLYPDQYSYRYHRDGESRMLHPAVGPSTVLLDCELTGAVPVPDQLPEVVWRAGIDLNPLDVTSASDTAWLEALIWPEHDDRRVRLGAAIELAKAQPVDLVRGDLVEQIESVVAQAPTGASVVVFHTAVLAYLDADARQRFTDVMNRLQVTWIANEARGVVPGVSERLEELALNARSTSDFVLARNGEPIAFTQPHGRALQWIEPPKVH